MINKIKAVLSDLKISEYLIREIKTESMELFFIRKSLDVRRTKDSHIYEVVVYNEFTGNEKPCKGNATASIYPGMTQKEIEDALKSAYLAASFVSNKWYELPAYDRDGKWVNSWVKEDGSTKEEEPVAKTSEPEDIENGLSHAGLIEGSRIMTEALFAEDKAGAEPEAPFINSAEMFLVRQTQRQTGSLGTDISFVKWRIYGEFVAQCRKPQDVETYADFDYDDLKTEALKAKVRRTLDYTKARTEAVKAPKAGKYDVIISGSYVKSMFDFYLDRAGANFVYADYPHFSKGENVCSPEGDAITLTLKAEVPYSSEGIPMKDRLLFDRGVLKRYFGGTRFSYYIGEEPTGWYDAIEVQPGTVPFEEMKKTPYLHIVNFSDFQMDSTTGSFGGEIRLAFLFDGEKEIPVTGGSINGKIFDVQKTMRMTTQLQEDNGFTGPFAIKLQDVNVAGE